MATRAAGELPDPDSLHGRITHRISNLLAASAIDGAQVVCRIDDHGTSLDVHLTLPVAVAPGLERALAVRVLDAVRAPGHTVGPVDVHVHHAGGD